MNQMRLDFGNLMSPRVEGGVTPELFAAEVSERFAAAMSVLAQQRDAGVLGFLDLPYATEGPAQVKDLADGFGQWFEDVVVLGIGGSGLGAKSLRDALLGPFWNSRSDEQRDHFPRLHIVDNPDPFTLHALLDRIDPARSLFNVISKSGATAETMAQYLVVRDRLDAAIGSDKARGHFLFTTDSDNGALRQIGTAEGIPMLPVPANVGGRFSVLSAVGLLPAAVSGIDVDALLAGAAHMEERCRSTDLEENPAGVLAVLLHRAHMEQGRHIHVVMPYADRLRATALWFQQLWAESLGKKTRLDGRIEPTGPTPMAALGATDQHSVLQLLMEGPHDKVVLFVDVVDAEASVTIPNRHPEIPALKYLGGHTLADLLATERRATAEALRREGRPNATIVLPRIDAFSLGQLYMFFEVATVIAGALYGVNPMDQPGVELSKSLTYGLMGRDGVPAPEIAEPDPDWMV